MSPKPAPRQLHSAVTLGTSLYVFGGFDENAEFRNDLFSFNPAKQSWKKISASGKIQGRHSHTAVVHGEKMYVYGGLNAGQDLGDLSVYSPTEKSWKEVGGTMLFAGRWGHTAVIHSNSMFIFGGTCKNAAVADILQFNFENQSWSTVESVSEAKPPARRYHTAVVQGDFMYVLGGLANNNNLNDFWRFKLVTREWEQLADAPAAGRRGQVAVIYHNTIIVHGGKQKSQSFGDTYQYKIDTKEWIKREDWQTEPTYFHSGAIVENKLFLFGGLVTFSGSSKSLCSNSLSCIQLGRPLQDAEFLRMPDFIIANHICPYLGAEDLIAFSSATKQTFDVCEKAQVWQTLAQNTFIVSDDIQNYRLFYLKERAKYNYAIQVYDKRLLEMLPLEKDIKAVIVGDGGVGKSAFVIRFIQDHFIDEYDPTIEDSYRKQISMVGENDPNFVQRSVMLDILDTAGPEEYSAMRVQYYKMGQIFIFAYDITRPETLEGVMHYHKDVCRVRGILSFFRTQNKKILKLPKKEK
eukprot:Phypoly_transcript_06415.p1 GENE.Phypoly_transcript_06415~~Phypoly_transcript_06415.p1  ORF type:complete len:521 (+),score=76.80 Phypoly_transcript_06415:80-1642(+)